MKEHYKRIEIDLSKQQTLEADLKAIQQINFTRNSDGARGAAIFFIIEIKETVLDFSQETVKLLYVILIWYNINIKWLNIR